MVRSHWIGPVFGVLALTGLAAGQTTTPLVPASTGDAEGQIVTVQEMGRPAQKCKVLKTWTEPDGTHAYQVQALDTGELMTIEGGQPNLVPSHGGPVRAAAMRIFHWGRRGDAFPPGTPQPPPDAVVVNPSPAGTEHKLSGRCPCLPQSVAKVAPSPYVPGPSAGMVRSKAAVDGSCGCGPTIVTKMDGSPYAPGPNVHPAVTAVPARIVDGGTCQCAPPVVTKVEPIPYAPAQRNPFMTAMPGKAEWKTTPSTPDVVWGPEIILPPPPDDPKPSAPGSRVPCRPTCHAVTPIPASIAAAPTKASPFKFWNPLTWRAKPMVAAGPNATVNAGTKKPADVAAKTPANDVVKTPADAGHKTPPVVAKVEVTPAQPGDWRESWGKIEPSKSAPTKTDLPAPPTVAVAPTHPDLLPIPTARAPAKNPGLMPPAPDAPPLPPPGLPSPTVAAPPKYPGALPSPTVATLPKYPGVLPSPTVATPVVKPNPLPPAPVAVKPAHSDVLPPVVLATPPLPPLPSPLSSPAANPALPPFPPPPPSPPAPVVGKDELPHAQVKADDPLKDPEKYTKVRPDGSFGPPDGPAKNKMSLLDLLAGKQPPPAKSADPPGMKSALAAGAPGATAGPGAAIGFDPNEPNAFSDPKVKVSSAPNAFTEPPPPPPPPPDPQAVALAGNAFVNTDEPKSPGEPTRSVLDTGLPTRYLTVPPAYPLPAPAAPRPASPAVSPPVSPAVSRPAPAVLPVGYQPGNPYDLTPMVAVLRESLYPSQREEAAEQLGAMDWRRQPQVVDILVERAREDPAPTVRAECVRSLGRLKANTLPAVEAVKFLQSDEDVRVRHEADDAYAALTGTPPKAAEPAGASSPQ